jgi:hypothetical protein
VINVALESKRKPIRARFVVREPTPFRSTRSSSRATLRLCAIGTEEGAAVRPSVAFVEFLRFIPTETTSLAQRRGEVTPRNWTAMARRGRSPRIASASRPHHFTYLSSPFTWSA